jgi:hypothetical protein
MKGPVVLAVCGFDRLVMATGAGTLGKYGRNWDPFREPLRVDGMG